MLKPFVLATALASLTVPAFAQGPAAQASDRAAEMAGKAQGAENAGKGKAKGKNKERHEAKDEHRGEHGERDERRIIEVFPKTNFFGVKTVVILSARMAQGVMLRIISLNEDAPLQSAAPGSPGDLR